MGTSQHCRWKALRKLGLLFALGFLLASGLTVSNLVVHLMPVHADAWSTLQTILARDTSVATSAPTATPSGHVPDGPLMGNGHMMAVVGGSAAAPRNLALTATPSASSSHEGSGWSTAYVNDSSLSTGWSSGDANTGSNHTEWVQVDMGTAQQFSEVDLYPRSDGANAGYGFPIDFTIAISNDGSTWTPVVTKTGYPLPSGVQSFAFTSQTARYVRLTGTNLRRNPNDSNHYRMQIMEFGVY